MLLLECSNMKKYFGDRLILAIQNYKIYSGDRIGIVGANGVGKTTLMNILTHKLEPDEGYVKLYGRYEYISQLDEPESRNISNEMASRFHVPTVWSETMSGGEKTRFKLAQALSYESTMIFADEPTSNLDMEGIELIETRFRQYSGALIIISHDRSFLDKLCNKIVEIDNRTIKTYNGNYSEYIVLKREEVEKNRFEYQQYIKEKNRLEKVIEGTRKKSKSIKSAPKRMGNSEARLHKMGGQKAKKNLERAVKNVEKRIEHLEVKEKPRKQENIQLDTIELDKLHSKIIIEGQNINKKFDKKVIFNNAEFRIYNGSKIALIGSNGCGKSTLIKMIMDKEEGIKTAIGAKIGYYSQNMSVLKEELSIMENVMESSIHNETFIRILLGRFLIKGEDIYKKVSVLSGGERVRVAFVKILLQDINLLVLDEITNYMDINFLEVIEEVLKEYDRTLLFVSHDRKFVSSIANCIMTIENHKIRMFQGNYKQYLESKSKKSDKTKEEKEKQIFILENYLSQIIGRLSMPSKKDSLDQLDIEYYKVLDELKILKNSVDIDAT